jgi:hypothetical protein
MILSRDGTKPSLWEKRTLRDPHLGQLGRSSSDTRCSSFFESGFESGLGLDSPDVSINGENNMH